MATLKVKIKRPPPLYVIPGAHPGLVIAGNINLYGQPAIRNPDGSVSTVDSRTYTLNGPFKLDNGRTYQKLFVLCSSVFNNHHDTSRFGAFHHYQATKQHLGIFDNNAHAEAYGSALHFWYVKNARFFPPQPRHK